MEIHPVAILMILFMGGMLLIFIRQRNKFGSQGMFFGAKVLGEQKTVKVRSVSEKEQPMNICILEGNQIGIQFREIYIRVDQAEALRLASILVDETEKFRPTNSNKTR